MTKLTHWIKGHQVTAFFILTFAITWGIAAFAILLPAQIRAIFGELTTFNPLFILAVAAPTISATILTLVLEGWSGLGTLYARLIRWRFGVQWYALVLVGIPFLGWLTSQAAGAEPKYGLSTPALIFSALLNLLISGPLGEELGWRGYALPRLLKQFSAFVASLILGAIWGVWHLPSFFVSGLPQSSTSLAVFLFGALCTSILVMWIFQHTGGSVLSTVSLHYMVNFSFAFLGAPFPAFTLVMLVPTILVVLLDKRFGWFQKP